MSFGSVVVRLKNYFVVFGIIGIFFVLCMGLNAGSENIKSDIDNKVWNREVAKTKRVFSKVNVNDKDGYQKVLNLLNSSIELKNERFCVLKLFKNNEFEVLKNGKLTRYQNVPLNSNSNREESEEGYKLQCTQYKNLIIFEYGFLGNCCGNTHTAFVIKLSDTDFKSYDNKLENICTKNNFDKFFKDDKILKTNAKFENIFVKNNEIVFYFYDDGFDKEYAFLRIKDNNLINPKITNIKFQGRWFDKKSNEKSEFCFCDLTRGINVFLKDVIGDDYNKFYGITPYKVSCYDIVRQKFTHRNQFCYVYQQ